MVLSLVDGSYESSTVPPAIRLKYMFLVWNTILKKIIRRHGVASIKRQGKTKVTCVIYPMLR